jgi:hypothetical protein
VSSRLRRALTLGLWFVRHLLVGPPGAFCGSDNERYERGKLEQSALAYRTGAPQLRH